RRLEILRVLRIFWRLLNKACSRGLNASPLARLTRLSKACSIPSIARRCQCWKVMNRICNCRQTSAALHRSVHTASTAWALSVAEKFGTGWRRRGVVLEGVDEFLVLVSIVDREFEFSFFGPENDRLTFHAADHVEGSLGLAAQRHLQEVFLDARLDGFAQLRGDFEEAVSRAQAFDALMRPLVIIVLDPVTDSFPGGLEAVELSSGKELLPDGFPEPFDLAQRHGMMRPGLEVVGAVFLH